MMKNQNLLKLVTGEAFAPWEYICATSFIDDHSHFGQYLININYLGCDKTCFYFRDKDGYLLKSNYIFTSLGQKSTIVLTSVSVHPSDELETVLRLNLNKKAPYQTTEELAYF
ncbi:hypothetical protein [Rufibacter hautae]|uniref:Uncharacterized protein n=1 Tax=Rufibacter hautae TaxID=2595005 RepID=A0A5B6TNR8_9BACT|nr:hypothetical protein [Rufibacter hautae]KAA3438043.1 hypothetical protein FOA19_12270 [Rufibacter hautae]